MPDLIQYDTPTQQQTIDSGDRLWGRYSIPVGITVVREGDTFVTLPTPTNDELEAAGTEGTDFFRGGYRYEIDTDTWEALFDAGLAGTSDGYGLGPYGLTPYGG